jgi:hypothetical protein
MRANLFMLSLFLAVQMGGSSLAAQSTPTDPQQPLTVCHVMQNLPLYSGKIVRIRGDWHGSYLEDKCDKQLQTGNHQWPNSILLILTQNLRDYDEPVDWFFGINEYNSLFRELLQFKPPVYATIVGRIDARAQLSPSPNGGSPVPYGYGHLGAFAARIVIKEIKDIMGKELRDSEPKIEYLDD